MDEMNLRNYAHLGDAVWELFVREKTVLQTQNAKELHRLTIDKVNAEFQNGLLLKLQTSFTAEESELMRRARNLPVPVSRRSQQAEYRMATAFEALIGWWYTNDKERLKEIFEIIKTLF